MIFSTSLDFFFFLVSSLHSQCDPINAVRQPIEKHGFVYSIVYVFFVKQKVTLFMYLFPDVYRRQFPRVGKLEQ